MAIKQEVEKIKKEVIARARKEAEGETFLEKGLEPIMGLLSDEELTTVKNACDILREKIKILNKEQNQ